ncbi:uncharacterized protein AMSG_01410 [Thecamonas trahens ATCC 50062]|uniref:Uncharacterized protein n=1 Tax=Thecamonas trahens ATCC 50062 TaxID=461836 RepID=A0A0L0DN15_THETB|nr:hypothetical protein AMSG_01410 [Thecamonas trahens ATCC 50062]KNC53699.1 hypothetical protein AMSG_01410 [Thecamonas trahens ATCC 50062]|eukprot:XP_013762013.1 hypothetical protein AMSG_01410 [Thecamonas trahens ATCC 50062]
MSSMETCCAAQGLLPMYVPRALPMPPSKAMVRNVFVAADLVLSVLADGVLLVHSLVSTELLLRYNLLAEFAPEPCFQDIVVEDLLTQNGLDPETAFDPSPETRIGSNCILDTTPAQAAGREPKYIVLRRVFPGYLSHGTLRTAQIGSVLDGSGEPIAPNAEYRQLDDVISSVSIAMTSIEPDLATAADRPIRYGDYPRVSSTSFFVRFRILSCVQFDLAFIMHVDYSPSGIPVAPARLSRVYLDPIRDVVDIYAQLDVVGSKLIGIGRLTMGQALFAVDIGHLMARPGLDPPPHEPRASPRMAAINLEDFPGGIAFATKTLIHWPKVAPGAAPAPYPPGHLSAGGQYSDAFIAAGKPEDLTTAEAPGCEYAIVTSSIEWSTVYLYAVSADWHDLYLAAVVNTPRVFRIASFDIIHHAEPTPDGSLELELSYSSLREGFRMHRRVLPSSATIRCRLPHIASRRLGRGRPPLQVNSDEWDISGFALITLRAQVLGWHGMLDGDDGLLAPSDEPALDRIPVATPDAPKYAVADPAVDASTLSPDLLREDLDESLPCVVSASVNQTSIPWLNVVTPVEMKMSSAFVGGGWLLLVGNVDFMPGSHIFVFSPQPAAAAGAPATRPLLAGRLPADVATVISPLAGLLYYSGIMTSRRLVALRFSLLVSLFWLPVGSIVWWRAGHALGWAWLAATVPVAGMAAMAAAGIRALATNSAAAHHYVSAVPLTAFAGIFARLLSTGGYVPEALPAVALAGIATGFSHRVESLASYTSSSLLLPLNPTHWFYCVFALYLIFATGAGVGSPGWFVLVLVYNVITGLAIATSAVTIGATAVGPTTYIGGSLQNPTTAANNDPLVPRGSNLARLVAVLGVVVALWFAALAWMLGYIDPVTPLMEVDNRLDAYTMMSPATTDAIDKFLASALPAVRRASYAFQLDLLYGFDAGSMCAAAERLASCGLRNITAGELM